MVEQAEKETKELIQKYGVKLLLESALEHLTSLNSDEEYIKKLIKNVKKTLKEYEDRYSKEIEKKLPDVYKKKV